MKLEDVYVIFPAIDEIASHSLRKKTAETLFSAIIAGGWNMENIHRCPIGKKFPNAKTNLVEHITCVAACCISSYDIVKDYPERNKVRFDRDTIICGALLHDVGKFVEYMDAPEGACLSQCGKQMRHPLSGAIIAVQNGLPPEIVQIIAMHSFEGDNIPHTAESEFIRGIDIVAFRAATHGAE